MIDKKKLYEWCSIPVEKLGEHGPRVPFRLVENSREMGVLMARELIDLVARNNAAGHLTRAIVPCGPMAWYEPFTRLVNEERVNLQNLVVFHMDECLDWEGNLLPKGHPYNFRSTMEAVFYNPVEKSLAVRENNRFWLTPETIPHCAQRNRQRPGRYHPWRMGAGRAYRIQSGPPRTL